MSERFDVEFTKNLVVALCSDQDFFRRSVDFLSPEMFVYPPVRFAYEVILKCYRENGRLPSQDVLLMAAKDAMSDPDIPSELKPRADDGSFDIYADTVSRACVGLSTPSTDRTPYMNNRLKEFIQRYMVSEIPSDAPTSVKVEMCSHIYRQMQEFDSSSSTNLLTIDEALAKMSETVDIRNRIGTGLASIDTPLNGGLAPGEIGLIIAGSGVGKSNAMLNFACANALQGNQSLYITLELSMMTVLSRVISMLTGIKASLISKGITPDAMARWKWSDDEKRRFHDLVDRDGKNRRYLDAIRILEYTDRHITPDTVKQDILKWKEERVSRGVDESRLGFVAVDWLNSIDYSTLSSVSKNQNQAFIMEKVVEALRQVGSSTSTRVWTAQQASRNALNKEALTMQDGRDSSGTFNPVDIALGLAIKKDAAAAGRIHDAKNKAKVDTERDMVMSIMKDRNSGATGALIKFYQGSSLRFFESKQECLHSELSHSGAIK